MTVSKKGSGRKGSSGTGDDDDVFDEDGMGTTEDMGAAKVGVYLYFVLYVVWYIMVYYLSYVRLLLLYIH